MKKSEFIERDYIVASQDAIQRTITSMDSKVFKRYVLSRLNDYQITHNQFNFLLDVTIDSLKEFEKKEKNEKV